LLFRSQMCGKVLKAYSESSFQDGSIVTNSSSLGLFWAEQTSFTNTSVNETATQNVWSVHKKSLWWNRRSLGSHVIDESEKCGHIWDAASRESVNFRGSGN
jgi:hypothetical protein